MIEQPVKANLESLQICLGLLPLPGKIIQDIERGMPKQVPEIYPKKVILTKEQVSEIEDFSRENIKLTYAEIYDMLIELDMLPQSDNGEYPSLARISEIISGVRKDMGLNKGGKNNGKLAYDMKVNGASDAEIAKSPGLRESSIRSIVSKHKKKLERGEV